MDKLFDAACQVQPPVREEQLAAIPAKRGIVLLLAEGAQPIVLLTAADLRSRVKLRLEEPLADQRKKTADLREITREIRWRLAASHFEADLAFLQAARQLWPRTYTSLLSWKPPWFVRVQPSEEFPRLERTRSVSTSGSPARLVGPFPGGPSADRFIEVVQDAFDLCRDYRCLRQAPNAQPCSYGQMGKCLSPCDGRTSLERYREVMAQAADFAAGLRKPTLDRLRAQMRQAAGDLQFERAGAVKSRLVRLGELNGPDYAFTAPLYDFRFILVQRGPGRRRLRAFLAACGRIVSAGDLAYPLQGPQVEALMAKMAKLAAQPALAAEVDEDLAGFNMGLVTHYLFSSPDRRGVIFRWTPARQGPDLAAAIEQAAGELHVGKKA